MDVERVGKKRKRLKSMASFEVPDGEFSLSGDDQLIAVAQEAYAPRLCACGNAEPDLAIRKIVCNRSHPRVAGDSKLAFAPKAKSATS